MAQMMWIWHSMVDYTRLGARYAATHCWQADSSNVAAYMRANVPVNVDQDQFSAGTAEISVTYYSRDAASGSLVDFTCDGDCSTACVPDVVLVSVSGYQFTRFFNYLGLNPVVLPNFTTTVPVEGAGCNPEDGSCSP